MAGKFKLTAPEPSEDDLQKSVADLLHVILRPEEAAFSHFPSGGYQLTPAAKARLYRNGLTRGWPDILVCYGAGRSIWFELKTRRGTLSPDQQRRHQQLAQLGHTVVVVRRVDDVLIALREHGVPTRPIHLYDPVKVPDSALVRSCGKVESGMEEMNGTAINSRAAGRSTQKPAQSP